MLRNTYVEFSNSRFIARFNSKCMNRKYWEDVALVHDEKIFDVFSNDAEKVILNSIVKYSSHKKSAMDLGCAIGNWLPLLSTNFKKVYAVDISKRYIELAREKNKNYHNIEYIHVDLSKASKAITTKADTVVCINALLTPNAKSRSAAYETVVNSVAKRDRKSTRLNSSH